MLKPWIKSARLRTLPLAASGTILGAAYACYDGAISWLVSSLALLTALLLQILSNFANDYGDYVKGTDNADRIGPQRALQSGDLSVKQMRNGIIINSLLTLISGLLLIFFASKTLGQNLWLMFGVLGILAIAAAIFYTVGKKAYGYNGMGDVMVFVFFGLVSVCGTYFLNTGNLPYEIIILGMGIGALSTGVLNLNNMRDIDNDIVSNKKTFASKLGFEKAKKYHAILVIAGISCLVLAAIFAGIEWKIYFGFLPILILPLLGDLNFIFKTKDKSKLDPFLKKLSLLTFGFAICFAIAIFADKLI